MNKPIKLPSGHWRIQFFDASGKRRSATFQTRSEAVAALRSGTDPLNIALRAGGQPVVRLLKDATKNPYEIADPNERYQAFLAQNRLRRAIREIARSA